MTDARRVVAALALSIALHAGLAGLLRGLGVGPAAAPLPALLVELVEPVLAVSGPPRSDGAEPATAPRPVARPRARGPARPATAPQPVEPPAPAPGVPAAPPAGGGDPDPPAVAAARPPADAGPPDAEPRPLPAVAPETPAPATAPAPTGGASAEADAAVAPTPAAPATAPAGAPGSPPAPPAAAPAASPALPGPGPAASREGAEARAAHEATSPGAAGETPLGVAVPAGDRATAGREDGPSGHDAALAALPRHSGVPVPPEYEPYVRALRQRIQERLVYPWAAVRRRLHGTIELELRLDATGRLTEVTALGPGGTELLREAAIRAVREATPFPFPAALAARVLTIRLPVVFQLR